MRMPLPRRTLSRVAVAMLGVVATASLLTTPAHADQRSGAVLTGYEVIAHRGYPARRITENTVEAFANAVGHGATAVELDVQLTKDRKVVVMHDQRLNRTTTCRGEVRLRTLRWIRTRCRGQRGGERIPGLAQALRWADEQDVRLLIEVKRPARWWTQTDLEGLTTLVHRRGMADRSRYLSFVPKHLERIRRADPGAELHAIARTVDDVAEQRSWADAIHAHARDLTAETIEALHADGVAVIGRAPNAAEDWSVLRDLGADGVVVDLLADYVAWARA